MARQSKNVNYSALFQTIDLELAELLAKCNNGKTIDTLKSDERHKLWNRIYSIIKTNNIKEFSADNINNLKNGIELMLSILNLNSLSYETKCELVDIVKYLNSDEFLIDDSVIANCISKVNEYWMVKMVSFKEEIPGMEYFTLKHLLDLCAGERPLVSDVQRLSAIRKSITATPFDRTVPSLRPLLIKLVQKLQISSSESGQRFIAQALNLSQKIMLEIHKTIMLDLGSCTKKTATNYGKIYVMSWHVASNETKEILEKTCFQHVMESMLKEQRTSLELNKNSHNLLAVLEVWHSERKKKNPDFITMLTNAYQPILWKYLQSGFNVHRCNATDVFFKAFPLQRTKDNAMDAERLLSLQYDTMLTRLTDDCHIVRIIAIREVCNILSHYWNSFSPSQIQNLMTIITKKCANDASSPEVRRMVYIGFQNLVKSPLSCDYVKQILPNMANNIHDVNQRVRIAFIQLLICIKEKKDPNFKYSDILPMFNIQYRLAKDNLVVGQWIVKLLMSNYFHSKMAVVEWTKRFIYLIKTYRCSYRNFFLYSSKSLPFLDACTIICEILNQLGVFVITKSIDDQENNENVEKLVEKKKGNKKIILSEWNGNKESSKVGNGSNKKCAFDDPEVVLGLFDIVTVLWVIHDAKLNKPENEEIRLKLYDTYIKFAQPFINYYKDCNLFLSVLSLSGNIPASLLRNNNITLPGYCIKMLKSIKMERSDEENEKIVTMLIALVKWGRGSEILEQVTLWLDAAFETQNMNETILPRRKVKINETIQPNSIVAINILDTLLKKEYVKLSILKKNYEELFFLWKFMSRIRKLIETRLDQCEPFSEDLVSDQFIVLCFRRYVKLIPLLKGDVKDESNKENQSQDDKTEIFVNHQKEIENVIEWAENNIFPLLQQEDIEEADADLIIAILDDLLYVSDNMITVHLVNNLFHFKTGQFVLKLLTTRFGIHFVKAASRITAALNFSAKLLFKVKDDLQIFSTVIPSLLSHTLNVLTNQKIRSKDIEKLELALPVIKKCFTKVLATYEDNLKTAYSLKENARKLKLIVGLFVDCMVVLLSQELPREDSVDAFSSFSQLQPVLRSLLSLFFNKKSWTSLFIHVINSKLKSDSYDLKETFSSVLLLNLFGLSNKKVNRDDLKKALLSAFNSLTKSKEEVEKIHHILNSSTLQTETETDQKKTWPSNVAEKANSRISTQFLSEEFDEARTESKMETSESNFNEKPEELSRTARCNETNIHKDFIRCGFEIIKNIQKTLEKPIVDENFS